MNFVSLRSSLPLCGLGGLSRDEMNAQKKRAPLTALQVKRRSVLHFLLDKADDFIDGVNMRLTTGSSRKLHWHTADEWAIMLEGKARVTVMNPDGAIFINDVNKGDLWLFPAGFPHSIQGLQPDGCEFLLVFDQGNFSEDGTFLLSETIAHTPR